MNNKKSRRPSPESRRPSPESRRPSPKTTPESHHNIPTPLWLLLWGLIYASFLTLDALFPATLPVTILRLTGIATCLLYALIHARKDPLLILALAFTLAADILLALDNVNFWGVLTFLAVQFFHLARLSNLPMIKLLIFYLPAVLLALVLPPTISAITTTIASSITPEFPSITIPPIIPLGTLYGLTLIANLVLAAKWQRRSPHSRPARRAFYGFLLFISCDFCVMLSYFATIGLLPATIQSPASYLAWAFYLPSQILICSSEKSVIQ